jgi:hypothetical protein
MIASLGIIQSQLDYNALSFINAAGITNSTQILAVNDLVFKLKLNNLWSKMYAVYPIIGGTSNTHSYNLINTGLYRITFFGSMQHSSTGMNSTGGTGYGIITGLIPSTVFNTTDLISLGFYSRSNIINPINGSQSMMGSNGVGTGGITLAIRATNGTSFYTSDIAGVTNRAAFPPTITNSSGFFAGSQNGSSIKLYRNGSDITSSQSVYASASISTAPLGILTSNNLGLGGPSGFISPHQCAFAHVGQKLTDAENTTLYNIVQQFQTILERDV